MAALLNDTVSCPEHGSNAIIECDIIVTHPVSGKPLANQDYEIHLPDGKTISGITDAGGHSSLLESEAIDGLKISLKKS